MPQSLEQREEPTSVEINLNDYEGPVTLKDGKSGSIVVEYQAKDRKTGEFRTIRKNYPPSTVFSIHNKK